MSNIVALPHASLVIEVVTGHVDQGGRRFGFCLMLNIPDASLRVWSMANGEVDDAEVPDAMVSWIQEQLVEILSIE